MLSTSREFQRVGRNERGELRRMDLMFAVDVPTPMVRLSTGRFRVVYRITSRKRLELIAIGPRAIIYEETYRRIAGTQRRSNE